ncbi:C6 transcription factor SndA [Penicillium expansum]|nr:C6 transcription factor SndA [Penicillium expansum]
MTEQTPRGYRPLAPRTRLLGGADGGDGPGNPAGGGVTEEETHEASIDGLYGCSGPLVCSECLTHGRECIFDESSDKRRKASSKRALDELDYYRSFVEDFFGIFRASPEETVQYLVNTIRAGAAMEQIREIITSIMQDENRSISQNSDVGDSNLNLNDTPNNKKDSFFNPR